VAHDSSKRVNDDDDDDDDDAVVTGGAGDVKVEEVTERHVQLNCRTHCQLLSTAYNLNA